MAAKKDPAAKPRKKSAVLSEQQAVYVEARATGLTKKDSLSVAGYSATPSIATELEKQPSVKQMLSAEYRKNAFMLGLTRDDVLEGMVYAIDQAKVLGDPMSQISGWREVAKICGYYAPEVKRIELGVKAQAYMQRLEQLGDDELLKLAEGDIIDGDFEEVPDA